jgi:hypothetical protein
MEWIHRDLARIAEGEFGMRNKCGDTAVEGTRGCVRERLLFVLLLRLLNNGLLWLRWELK